MKQTKGDQIFLKILYRQTKRGLILMKLKNLIMIIKQLLFTITRLFKSFQFGNNKYILTYLIKYWLEQSSQVEVQVL